MRQLQATSVGCCITLRHSTCQLVSNAGRRRLRSADIDTYIIPHTRTHLDDRSFSVAGPWLCNSLPVELHQSQVEMTSLDSWRHFCLSDTAVHRDLCFSAPLKPTYLLTYMLSPFDLTLDHDKALTHCNIIVCALHGIRSKFRITSLV